MDFALILFIFLVVTGFIWAVDRVFMAPRRKEAMQRAENMGAGTATIEQVVKEPVYVEYARTFFPVILIVFLLRSFIVEPFHIPSGSMMPGLLPGDYILVKKYAYGIRLPILHDKIVDVALPKRGDVAVFRYPGNLSENYIKRIVGIPGDHVTYKDKKLYINGTLMPQTDPRPYAKYNYQRAQVRQENLHGVKHDILVTDRQDIRPVDQIIPPGKYFVMGDNRDESNDSRFWGFVPEENLVGQAFFIWMSWDKLDNSDKPFWSRILWYRMGNTIE